MSQLNYEAWAQIKQADLDIGKIRETRFHPLVMAFMANTERINMMGHLPFLFTQIANAQGYVFATTMERIRLIKDYNPETMEADIATVVNERIQSEESQKAVYESIDGYLGFSKVGTKGGMEALLSSAIILGFGAFENLAIDLWLEAVNMRPRSLAMNALSSPDTKPKEEKGTKAMAEQEKMISFRDLSEHQFNVSDKMGYVLRQRKVVSFDTLEGIHAAYTAVFLAGEKKCRELHEIFDDKGLFLISAIRNLLAHKGGIIDDRFAKKAARCGYKDLIIGEPFPLDFKDARGSLDKLFATSAKLVYYVDEWLQKNPE